MTHTYNLIEAIVSVERNKGKKKSNNQIVIFRKLLRIYSPSLSS